MSHHDKTLPIGGGWVLLIEQIPCKISPQPLTIWYAMPGQAYPERSQFEHGFDTPMSRKDLAMYDVLWRKRCGGQITEPSAVALRGTFGSHMTGYWDDDQDQEILRLEDVDTALVMNAQILTPEGEVHLKPHEYKIIADIDPYLDMVDGEHLSLEELGGIKAAKKLNEMVFYCRSRGISRLDALKMTGGTVKRSNVYYLKFHEAYAEHFGISDTAKFNITHAA